MLSSSAADDTVDRLAAMIDQVLSPIIPSGVRCALLDFPSYSNVGDSAIWLGQTKWLAQRGAEIVYTCDTESYSREHLSDRIGDGVILLSGGGNLGDFWIHHQRFRESVIQHFPANPIVQLPQTIYFMDEWDIGEAARVFNAHRNLTVLCRDHPSLDFARAHFTGASALCPDMAFALGTQERRGASQADILWLGRTDAESRGEPLPEFGERMKRADWLKEVTTETARRYEALRAETWQAKVLPALHDEELRQTCDSLATERLERGLALLSRGRVVITDRLHGHILCLLLGIPHVLLDNSYGKLSGFHRAWTSATALVRQATSPAQAVTLAQELLANCAGG